MIPSVLSQQLRQGVEDFLRTTFPVSTPFFHGIIDRLLAEEDGVFKGPYLSIQLPFRQGSGRSDYFPDVPLKFPPYLHQEQAFDRLSGIKPKSTIVATGTGSGKTESFLYPILDHCFRHRGEPGIKAILIYPMNALAMDQAGRIAKIIYTNPNLKGHVTAGLYVGQSEKDPHAVMSQSNIITNKEMLRISPPDILLTNYKMLDYLLIRAKDYPLWKNNGPETLRFLVVDELHTFDGAQGTDLACLIRRLKARLDTPENHLCCIGTSATLGANEKKATLLTYASEVFGELFDENAIIMESRLTAGEFLENSMITRVGVVSPDLGDKLNPDSYSEYKEYILSQHELWFGEKISENEFKESEWRITLGDKLREHSFFQNLLKVLKGKTKSYDEILFELEKCTPEFKEADKTYRLNLISSLLALVSTARTGTKEKNRPFLHVRYQLWLRELRRMAGKVSKKEPRLAFSDDLNDEQLKKHMPVIHCRECNSMGWAGLKRTGDNEVNPDLQPFYISFFKNDPKVTFLFPESAEPQNLHMDGQLYNLCAECLNLTTQLKTEECPNCGQNNLIRVFVPNTRARRKNEEVGIHNCPYCGGHNSLTILGSRAASLTSVLISQLYSSTFNDDKKLLTFSDSVQDAAHRAGFFTGRTYRFNFRSALQQFILKFLNKESDVLTLAALPEKFTRFWLGEMDENSFISTFLPPNMAWFADYEILKQEGRLPKDSKLLRDVKKRIEWEIFSEYGFRTRIGRTLEKTSSSIAHLNFNLADNSIKQILEQIQNEIGGLKNLDEHTLKAFILGLLTHMKNQGGIYYQELATFIERWGETFIINRIPWMPNFSGNARTPAFLTTKRTYRFDQLLSSRSSRMTWCESWADKCFSPLYPLVRELISNIYDIVLKILVSENILIEKKVNNELVWGIMPDALRISDKVVQFSCMECSHNVSVPLSEKEYWEGAHCLRFHCYGKYRKTDTGNDYYGKLYASGNIERIFAAEHTGLLERDEREKLEEKFKRKKRKPWDPNLLSCTPTLELGIDIGELSSVILCSVPPAQANYIQRIGRAGRQDGNALNLTVANAKPHDLYFFAEPEAMISGQLDPPGIFLNASAVLERQFTAFCFDKWVETGISENAIPLKLRNVLSNLEPVDIKKFPHNFLNFIETRQILILDEFEKIFSETLKDESKNYLRIFVKGDRDKEGSLGYRIIDRLHYHYKERESLKKKVNSLKAKIRKKRQEKAKNKNHQKELDELIREKNGLHSLVTRINDRHTLNFFTDEGLIPNYAFPEAGVMLRSIIYRRKKTQEQGSNYDTFTYDYERPAVSAISELAPAGTFYAGGRKVCVDQVDLSVSEVEIWRLCNNCSYMAIEGTTQNYSTCPQCGSALWSDSGQKRQMLKMRQMFATTSDRESRISDDNDQRDSNFYNRQMIVGYKENDITDAYKIDNDDFPFGFEFLSKATFREINFGEKEDIGEKISVAGVELPRKGFIICKYCGKVQDHKGEIKHALTCPSRKKDSEENLTDCVYLYREFSSEAILMLLPVITFEGSDRKLHSFIAALHLGLKQMFGGNIDHLQTALHEEPVPDSTHRKKYLALYDTVPGGTGYLKQLMRSQKPMMKVFEKALDALRSCPCNQNPEKDGCYRCLFAYRRSYNMAGTSRDVAIEMLSEILGYEEELTRTNTLKDIKINSLFDSELEARFIEALRRVRKEDLPVSLKKEIVNGKPGYFYKIGDKAWYIELQVNLGQADGVGIPSKADFLFRPARAQDSSKPIAVFTDGFAYHKDRIGKDMAQRCAIAQSGKYHVWSLSWKDIENRYNTQRGYFENYVSFQDAQKISKYNQLLELYGIEGFRKTSKMDSFDWLINILQNPEVKKWRYHAFVHGLVNLDNKRFALPEAVFEWTEKLQANIPEEVAEFINDTISNNNGTWFYGLFEPDKDNNLLQLFIAINKSAVQESNISEMYMACCLDDRTENLDIEGFEAIWNGYLRLYNLMQFVPHAYFTTRQGKIDGYSYKIAGYTPEGTDATKGEWDEILELTDVELHGLINKLAENNCPVPETGYELVNDDGEIVAEAELGWPDINLAFLQPEQIEFSEVFKQSGWRVFPLKDVIADPETYLNLFNE